MAPRKRGGSARVQPSKNEKKPNSKDAHEEPKEERKSTSIHVEEENPPAKKPRRSSRTASVPDGKEAGEEVKGQVVVENNVSEDAGKSKNIVIEHCKQCQCFKVRALKVEKELKGAIPNVEVTINPEKPRRGCFEIRDGEGNIFLSLQDMPRPFTKLKQYDLDGTISEIIEKIK